MTVSHGRKEGSGSAQPDNREAETPEQADRHFDEHKVVELLKNPESEGFLSAIEELSPDEIGRILHALNAEKAEHFGPTLLNLRLRLPKRNHLLLRRRRVM